LDQSFLDAIPFPADVAESDSSEALFDDATGVYRDRLGLPEDLSTFFTSWNFASWTPELTTTPITMAVTATTVSQGIALFRLLRPLGRRSLIVGKLGRQLPFDLRPTLLIADQTLSAKDLGFWSVCNTPGVYVAGTQRNTICDLACARAVLLRPEDSPDEWGDQVMQVLLPAVEFPRLSERQIKDIAQEFQPRFQRHRLDVLTGREAFSAQALLMADSELARSLFACVPPKPEIVQLVAPLLESHEQERLARRLRNPRVAVVEVLWGPAHALGKMRVSEIATRVNALLRNRGEICEHNSREIGWMLKKMRLPTHRNGSGQVVQFSSEIRHRLHQLARESQLRLPTVQDCPDCAGPQAIEPSRLV
jgi:hypothetical protein